MEKNKLDIINNERNLFLDILKLVEYTSEKYSDNKEQFQLRLEGVLKDCAKVKKTNCFTDLTRAKISENDQLGCRDKMLEIANNNDVKYLVIKNIYLMKTLINNTKKEEALKECEAYKDNCILSKTKNVERLEMKEDDLMIVLAEYIVKNIAKYKEIDSLDNYQSDILELYYNV